jgi:hypothetical protein
MAELTDALKYQQKEIAKLKAENIKLKAQPRFKLEEENLRLLKNVADLKEENERLKRTLKAWEFAGNDMINRLRGGK